MNVGLLETYGVYGVAIRSALPLPELAPSQAAPDALVRLAAVDAPAALDGTGYARGRTPDGAVVLHWQPVGTFLVRAGREIVVDPVPGVEQAVLRLFLLTAALGVLLQQRGCLVLHASAVAIGTGAVALLGGSGWGKSSLAAALHARGHPILADDVTAVRLDVGRPTVLPGFPQLKLWPDTAAALGEAVDRLPRLRAGFEKRARRVAQGFALAPLALQHLYVLAPGPAPAIEPLAPHEAFVELLRHSYAARALGDTDVPEHFGQCSRLASQGRLSRLRHPRSLEALPALASLVEQAVMMEAG